MKPLLILFREPDLYYFEAFTKAAKDNAFPVILATFDQIRVVYDPEIKVLVQGKSLETFGAVYYRTIADFHDLRLILSSIANDLKIPVFDKALAWPNIYNSSKAYDTFLLQKANLPLIKTVALLGTNLENNTHESFPLIVKDAYGKQGHGAYKVESEGELEELKLKLKRNTYLLQEFIPNDGDIRVLVLNSQVVGAIKRRAPQGEFRNNVSQGGTTTIFPLTDEMKSIATRAATTLNYFLAGVDLIFDNKNQQWLIMEVNRGPQFKGFAEATGIDVASEIIKAIKSSL